MVSACPNLQVVDDRNRVEATAVASKLPIKIALKETGMSSRAKDAFEIVPKEEDGRRAGDHVTFVELVLELTPSTFPSFLFPGYPLTFQHIPSGIV